MQGPSESLAAALSSCSLSRTLKPLSQRNTARQPQASLGMTWRALQCYGHRRRGTVTVHWQVRGPAGRHWHHDAAWLPPSRALPRLGGSNNPK